MRVLYLNPFSQRVSGPDESLIELLAALVPVGIEPHVVLPRPGPQVARYQALGARVHYAPLTVLSRGLGAAGASLLPLRLARGTAAVLRIARRERVDLVHTNMEVVLDGAVAARLLRLPHVLHYRGNTLDEPRPVFDLLTRVWTAGAARVLCISEGTAAIFRRRGRGARVEVVHDPIDVERFAAAERSDEVRRALGAAPGQLLVGTVCRIHPRKEVETFLHACAIVAPGEPGARFAVVGCAEAPEEIAYEARMRALAVRLGISDRLCWAGARTDMPAVMRALDLFVLASRHEGFGRVVPEAQAAGVPSVLAREGALPELAEEGMHALFADPGDARSLAARMAALLGDEAARRGMGQRARANARRFAAPLSAARVAACYRAAAATGAA